MPEEENQSIPEDELIKMLIDEGDAKTGIIASFIERRTRDLKNSIDSLDDQVLLYRENFGKLQSDFAKRVRILMILIGGLAILSLAWNVILSVVVFSSILQPTSTPTLVPSPTATAVPPTQTPVNTLTPSRASTVTVSPTQATLALIPTVRPSDTPTRAPTVVPSPTNTSTPTVAPVVCINERCVADLKIVQDNKEVERTGGKLQIKSKTPFAVSFTVYSKEREQLEVFPDVLFNDLPKAIESDRRNISASATPTSVSLGVNKGIDGPGRYLVKVGYVLNGSGDDFRNPNGEPAYLEIEIVP